MSKMSHVEGMANREWMNAIVADFLERSINEDAELNESGPEFKQHVRELTKIGYDHALDIIFEHAESEIEKIFLNSVVLGFLRMDPMGLMMLGPSQNAPAYIKNLQQAHQAVSKMRATLAKEGKGRTVAQYIDWLERERQIVDREELERWRTLDVIGPLIGHSFHIIPQAGFPDIKVGSRGIRTDMLVSVPLKPRVKIIVECDGFQWHGNKDSFTADRQRDRLLRSKGYEVIRYSGSEIVKNPVICAADFVQGLVGRRAAWLSN